MKESIVLQGLTATVNASINATKTEIRGEIFPFVSRFNSVKFKIEINKSSPNSANIVSDVQLSGTYGGAELTQYLRAIEAANGHVQELECYARNLEDHSIAALAITQALEAKDFNKAHTLTVLTSCITNEMGDQCNWNFSNVNKAFCLFDAIVTHKSFQVVVDAMTEYKSLCDSEKYDDIGDNTDFLNKIGEALVEKVGLSVWGKDSQETTMAIINMVRDGKTIMDFKASEVRVELEDCVKDMIAAKTK